MTVHELVEGVLAADRAAVGRALTLVESTRSDHRVQARELLDVLLAAGAAAVFPSGTVVTEAAVDLLDWLA